MNADALRKAFAGGKSPAVVAAVGPEAYLREETLKLVAQLHLGSADSNDVIVIQPDEGVAPAIQTAARFLGEARTGSLFGGRKVVALRDAEDVVGGSKDAFRAWLAAPSAANVGVLLATELPDEFVAAVASAGVVVPCGGRGTRTEPPEEFVRRRAADRGKRLAGTEARLVVERIGDEFTALENAVEILSLHAGDADAITTADIEALFRSAREGTIWEFGDLLAEGEVAGALTEASRCFAEGVPEDFTGERVTFDERRIAQKLLGSFTTSVVRALALRRQIDAGAARGDLVYAPPAFKGFLPWKAKERAARIASRRRPEALEALLLRAEETERGMKSGGADGRLAVARLATGVGMIK